jgi:hypothetical protein
MAFSPDDSSWAALEEERDETRQKPQRFFCSVAVARVVAAQSKKPGLVRSPAPRPFETALACCAECSAATA